MTPTRAQDIIRKIDGGLIEGKVISSSGESVQFSIQIDTTWERFSIPKDRVESIVYVDGGFEQFTNTYISGTSIDTSSQEADLPYLADKKQSDHVVDGIVVESDNAVETTPKNKIPDEITAKVVRRGITLILLDNTNDPRSGEVRVSFSNNMNTKNPQFDDNGINDWLIPQEVQESREDSAWITKTIQNNKIPNKIIDAVFNDGTGSWTLDKMIERVRYDLTDLEYETLKSGYGGISSGIKRSDIIESMLNEFYIATFYYHWVLPTNEYYDWVDKMNHQKYVQQGITYKPVARTSQGLKAYRVMALYKFNFDSAFLNTFYATAFSDSEGRLKLVYPIQLVSLQAEVISATQPNPLPSFIPVRSYSENLSIITRNNLNDLESSNRRLFAQTSVIYKAKPIQIKVGRKQGLVMDQRYFVYELRQKGDSILEQRIAVVRAKRVVDNRKNSEGNTIPSDFYQVAGKRIEEGMIVKRRSDLGLSLYLGHSIRSKNFVPIIYVKGSTNISRIVHSTQFRFELGYQYSQVRSFDPRYPKPGTIHDVDNWSSIVEPKNNEMEVHEFSMGFRKDLHFGRILQFSPYVGLDLFLVGYLDSNLNSSAIYNLKVETDDPYHTKIRGLSVLFGADFGVNLTQNFKVILSYNIAPARKFDINSSIAYFDSNQNFTHYGSSSEPYFNLFNTKGLFSIGFRLDI